MKAFSFYSLLPVLLSAALVVTPLWAQGPTPGMLNVSAAPEALQIHVMNAESLQTGVQAGAKQSVTLEVTDSAGSAVSNAAVMCRLPEAGPTGTFPDGTHAAVTYTDAQGRATVDGVQWGDVIGSVAMRLTASKGAAHTGILLETTVRSAPAEAPAPLPRETTVVTVPVPVPAVNTAPELPPAPVVAQPTISVSKPDAVAQPGQLAPAAQPVDATPAAKPPGPNKLTPAVADPTVSVTRTSAADAPHGSHAKWYVLAIVAVAAGAGAAFAMKGKSSSTSSTPTASISIGTPSVSVGGSH